MAAPASPDGRETEAVTGSGFEKKGGYPATGPVVSVMPKAPDGPAPGLRPSDSAGADSAEARKQ